ncbi:hypothetical protein B0T26DRAFT_138505 [Lasiosphaeria miniovina]|uniref:Uncharacterized protein n=1 Tax=Lasiosphaeria miniovina TaxID=1954250 RepID=A0AA40B4F2_9PEZI|nr:uncharacterized protein B0T26DRAFT_138505 [Lasiosphaeria miniovina]KAK0727510.1 hypothetical protein B0T26DRAFT_138505 [Lasiosphaeria miniovina]
MSVHYVSVTNCNGVALAITKKRTVIELLKSGAAIAIQKWSLLKNNKRVPVSGCILLQRFPPHTELLDLQPLTVAGLEAKDLEFCQRMTSHAWVCRGG